MRVGYPTFFIDFRDSYIGIIYFEYGVHKYSEKCGISHVYLKIIF